MKSQKMKNISLLFKRKQIRQGKAKSSFKVEIFLISEIHIKCCQENSLRDSACWKLLRNVSIILLECDQSREKPFFLCLIPEVWNLYSNSESETRCWEVVAFDELLYNFWQMIKCQTSKVFPIRNSYLDFRLLLLSTNMGFGYYPAHHYLLFQINFWSDDISIVELSFPHLCF